MRRTVILAAGMALLVSASACFSMRTSSGGGQHAKFTPPRRIDPADVAVPAGYRVEVIAEGLTFPTGVAFDDSGAPWVVESGYSYGEKWTTPRLLRIDSGGKPTVVATGGRNGPWNGVAFAEGSFWVDEGGELEGGRVLRISRDGKFDPVIQGLPSLGDHHTNGPIGGNDGWIYFGQGTATNSGIVGEDNATFGWLLRHPEFHDIPCRDVTLTGETFESRDARNEHSTQRVKTGAFAPMGTAAASGDVVNGAVPCSGSVMRFQASGGAGSLELVAWGFRNPFGLAFSADGTLYVSDNGYDDRGSRPVHGAADLIWAVKPGVWYGWPDYSAGMRLDDGDHFLPPGKPKPKPLLASAPNPPPEPVAALGVHTSSDGIDFSRSEAFGYAGQLFIAQFGDMAPGAGKTMSPVGFKVRRLDVNTGVSADFAVNRGSMNGPASRVGGAGLERPVAVRFDPSGRALYIVDFGVMTMGERGPEPREETGVLWKVTREP